MRRADSLATIMCRLSRNFGSLNALEPSGPVQVCNGIGLPFKCTELHYELLSSSVQLQCISLVFLIRSVGQCRKIIVEQITTTTTTTTTTIIIVVILIIYVILQLVVTGAENSITLS